MKHFRVMGMALAAALGFAGMARAAVIYDNGVPNYDGIEATNLVQADDFTLGTASTVTGAGIYIAGFGGIGNWDGAVNYWIFSDSGGPDSILASGAGQNVSTTDAGDDIGWCCGGNVFLVEFNFEADFAAAAGVTYWLGIHLSEDFTWDDIYWVISGDLGTGNGRQSFNGTFDNWFNHQYRLAFYLIDDREAGESGDPVDTPAPAGLMLLGLGLAALGAARRRKA